MPDSPVTSAVARIALTGGRPALTWYGDDAERVELSGAVLANWVTKSANLLLEEIDAGPGFRVRLDLPGHWRAVVWALAVWRVGACVVVGHPDAGPGPGDPEAPDEPADAVVTADPVSSAVRGAAGRPTRTVAVALPALARRFAGALPPGALDGAAVLGYGDALGWVPETDLASAALRTPEGTTSHADLVRDGAGDGRVLVDASALPLFETLRTVLDTLAAGGSVVLVGGSFADELRADDERRTALLASERVTG